MLTGILLANGNISASILNSLFNENLVKEGEVNYHSLWNLIVLILWCGKSCIATLTLFLSI